MADLPPSNSPTDDCTVPLSPHSPLSLQTPQASDSCSSYCQIWLFYHPYLTQIHEKSLFLLAWVAMASRFYDMHRLLRLRTNQNLCEMIAEQKQDDCVEVIQKEAGSNKYK